MSKWKKNLILVWISQFLSLCGFSLALPFAPYFIQELGIADPSRVKFYAALSASVTAVSLAFMAPVWGVLADRYGRKAMMLRANFAAVGVLTLMAFSVNVQMFIALRFLQGMFTGTINAAQTFIAGSTPEDRQGVALGSLSAAVFSGLLVGPLVGGFMADAIGYRLTFGVSGILLFVAGLVVLLAVKEEFVRPAKSAPGPLSWKERIAGLGPGAPILVLLFFMAAARSFDRPILPLYVQEIHGRLAGAARWTGALNGMAAVGATLSGLLLGRLSDRIAPPLIGKLSALGAGVFMVLMGVYPSFAVIFPARFFLAFCAGGLDPVFQVWLSRVTHESKRGTIFGWGVSFKAAGMALSPLLSGWIAVHLSIPMVYFVAPVLFWFLLPLIHVVSRSVVSLSRRTTI